MHAHQTPQKVLVHPDSRVRRNPPPSIPGISLTLSQTVAMEVGIR